MKRIAFHPDVHPAQPWCVTDTSLPDGTDISRFPKVALFDTRSAAQAAFPDAVVDRKFGWECGIRVSPPADFSK